MARADNRKFHLAPIYLLNLPNVKFRQIANLLLRSIENDELVILDPESPALPKIQ